MSLDDDPGITKGQGWTIVDSRQTADRQQTDIQQIADRRQQTGDSR
jgi:hypothetical protein